MTLVSMTLKSGGSVSGTLIYSVFTIHSVPSKGAGVQRSLCTAATVPMDTEGTYLDKTYAIEVVQCELRNANLNQSHDLMLSGCRVTLTVF